MTDDVDVMVEVVEFEVVFFLLLIWSWGMNELN